jgi:hypothetical protein
MDTTHLAALRRSLAAAASRRGLLAGLSGGVFASGLFGPGVDDVAAKRSGDRRRKRKRQARRKRRKGQNQPVTRVDATCAGSEVGVLVTATENERLAQTFTALASGPLVRAEVLINKPADSVGAFVLRLSPVAQSGEVFPPTNDVLAETSIANDAVPEGESVVAFAFANPFSVIAGTTYGLVLTRPGGESFAWVGGEGNPCAGASFASQDQTGSFIDLGADLIFTTFVRS